MDSNNGVPQKPWEINRGQSPNTNNYGNLRSSSHLVENKIPPPVPVRPTQQVICQENVCKKVFE